MSKYIAHFIPPVFYGGQATPPPMKNISGIFHFLQIVWGIGIAHIIMQYRYRSAFKIHCKEIGSSLFRPTVEWGRNVSMLNNTENIKETTTRTETSGA